MLLSQLTIIIFNLLYLLPQFDIILFLPFMLFIQKRYLLSLRLSFAFEKVVIFSDAKDRLLLFSQIWW